MRITKLLLFILCFSVLYGQDNPFKDDYKFYGRKEAFTPGSAFSALGGVSIFVNPANIAFITDNRVGAGLCASSLGYGYFISWVAPNFSIANAKQLNAANEAATQDFKKTLLQFNFGVSTTDLGLTGNRFSAAVGINVKNQGDYLYDENDDLITGGSAVAMDLGLIIKWRVLALGFALANFNEPKIEDTAYRYRQGYIIGLRYENKNGLKIALQGLSGKRYRDMDFGLNLGVAQGFFEQRLVSRLQLTSYFDGPEATMQNIAGSVGYRISSKGRLFYPLKDLEFSYTLSFLTLPQNIGTHMIAVMKYF